MPLSNVLILIGIVAAFGLFALVLAWGSRQTRNIERYEAPRHDQDQEVETKKAA
jgi:multisubunit Na+/H+ antiporter MnhC subunit